MAFKTIGYKLSTFNLFLEDRLVILVIFNFDKIIR